MGSSKREGRTRVYVSGAYEYAAYHGSWTGFGTGNNLEVWATAFRNGGAGEAFFVNVGVDGIVGGSGGPADEGTFVVNGYVPADTACSWRVAHRYNGVTNNSGSLEFFTSGASMVTFGTITASNPTQTTIDFSGQWYPNTTASTATAYLYYKKTTDPTWTLWGNSGAQSGTAVKTYTATVTGLASGTSYQFYLYVSRTTSSNQTASSSVVSESTIASTPTVTTQSASSISHNSATLNGTIDANNLATNETFVWNGSAQRVIDYVGATNVTSGKVLTVGSNVYTFLTDTTATGQFAYSGQPSVGETVVINGVTYTFRDEVAARGGKLAYVDATNPTADKIVTIPSGGAEPNGVYKFKVEQVSTGGVIAYVNASNPPALKTVTIPSGGANPNAVYTFVSTVVNGGDVKRSGNADLTMTNLVYAINKSGGTEGAGQDYLSFDGDAHALFTATIDTFSNEIDLTTLPAATGTVGNVTLSSNESSITVVSPTGGSEVDTAGDVLIGASADATMLNLSRCINKSGGTEGVGEDYMAFDFGSGPAAHPLVVATHDSIVDEVTFVIAQVGNGGNVGITTDEASITPTDPTGGSWVAVGGDVLIGAAALNTFLNLTHCINNSGGTSGVGEEYLPAGGAENPDVTAGITATEVNLTAITSGTIGNVVLSDTSGAITTTTMSGGTDLPGGGYQVLIGTTADQTMQNLVYGINKSGGTEGINYVAAAAHPDVVATIGALDDYVHLTVPTNTNPAIAFTTDEATFTLTVNAEGPYANETAVQAFSNDGTTAFSAALTGLTKRRTYYYKAKSVYTANGGGTLYGDAVQFTTGTLPEAAAIEEEHMQIIQFDGQYGQAKSVYFTLRSPSGSSSDLFYTDAAPLQADCKIFKNGVYDNTSDAAPSRIISGASAIYKLILSADEMGAENIDVIIHDAAGSAFRDAHIQVRTAMRLSEIDVDATNGPVDATALTLIGNDDGHGMLATSTGAGSDINAVLSSMWLRVAYARTQANGSKIQLDLNASAVNGYYNGCVVVVLGGLGAGQARVIIDYAGATGLATVDSAWSTIPDNTSTYAIGPGARPWSLTPGAELTSIPGPTASYGEFLQLLFHRFAMKINQTASAQTWYKSNDIDQLFVRTVSDDGTTQTIERLANA
jgi:hypothetical protein